jgi:hypothetical protein
MDTKEILLKAADYMEEHGKAQGMYVDEDGQVCAVGAITVAVAGIASYSRVTFGRSSNSEQSQAINLAIKSVKENLSPDEIDIHFRREDRSDLAMISFGWSDVNSKETVVNKLREIAAK